MARSPTTRLWFRLRELARRMWVRVSAFSLAGVLLALVSPWAAPFLPRGLPIDLASGAVDDLLHILASSMLAVTTFSMSIIVAAFGAATSNATPRATRLLAEDSVAQTAVAIFIGSFLFSIVGIIGIAAGYYPDGSRVLLFLATLADIALITWALLRWVDHLNRFGRVSDIIARIEAAASDAARLLRDQPALGALPTPAGLSAEAPLLAATTSGHVRHIDMAALQQAADAQGLVLEILRLPGKFVHAGEPLLRLSAPAPEACRKALAAAFSLGVSRSYDQDPAYGLIVLSEVASRALSPAINDPGTAIEVLRAGTRVLRILHGPRDAAGPADPVHGRIHAPPLDLQAVYRAFFSPIARYGAGLFEVQQTLQDCLEALALHGGPPWAQLEAERARSRAHAVLEQDWERALIG